MNWEQLKTIGWLRWRLTRNQWAKGGGVGAVIAAAVAIMLAVIAIGSFIGAIAAGTYLLGQAKPLVVMAVWLGLTTFFFFFWLLGLLQELQRSETIDLQRLMHLPVALGQIFVINYLASHLTISLAMMVPAMIGLAVGLILSRGIAWILMIPLALSMIFMITAWTYYLRGWLASLMNNPRRRRAIVMGLSAAVILLVQAPNIYFNVIRREGRPRGKQTSEQRATRDAERQAELERLAKYQVAIPPLWVPVGARGLAEGRAWPALAGTLGCALIGALGLRRAYRSTMRFYSGDSGAKGSARSLARAPASPEVALPAGRLMVERTLPGVPEQAAALALASFRSMLRAPEVKMQWGTSFIVTIVVGIPLIFRAGSTMPDAAKPFVATGIVVFSLFLLVQFLTNQFGMDREGFRALVLSPMDRRLILLGKNLACVPPAVISATILLIAVSVWLHLTPLVFAATLCQLAAGLFTSGVGGNMLSILVPYRIQAGSLKPTKMPGSAMFMLFVSQLSFPLAISPAFIPPLVGFLWERWGGPLPASVVNLMLSVALAAVMGLVYWLTLNPLGRLLQRRETKILTVVSAEVE